MAALRLGRQHGRDDLRTDAFAALDPTLSGLIPGGMDETPQAWISTDYKSKNPWSAIFGTGADEDDRGKQNLKAAQGFLKTVLGL